MKKLLHKIVAISAATLISSLSASADVTVTQSTDSEGYTYNDGQLTRSDRNVTSIVLTGDQGNSQTISISNKGTGRYVWQNKVETPTTTFAPGETITVTSTSYGNSEWMHTYVYIDYNGDKTFTPEFEDDGYTVTENSELVTYNTYCTSGGDGPFYDSKGVKNETEKAGYALIGGPTPSLPSFKLPTKTGTYRVRYKVDWNSIDPIGTSSIATNGGEIIDFKITVATVETATVTIDTPDSSQGTLEVTKKGDNTPLTSPAVLPVGTELEITAQAAKMSSYALQGVYADEELISTAGYFSYTVQGDVTLSAKFVSESDLKPVVTVETPTNGTISVKDSAGNDVSGEVESGTEITITATPDKDYLFGSLSINGTAVETTDGKYTTTVTANTAISATFTEKYAHTADVITRKNGTTNQNFYLGTITLSDANDGNSLGSITGMSTTYGRTVYQNMTGQSVSVYPNQEINVTTTGGEGWSMHMYAYIDFNNDGIFNTDLNDNGTPATNSDVVSYNLYNDKNSKGDSASGSFTYNNTLPTFKIPADLEVGTYRMRYKVDWDNIDPAGSSSIGTNAGEIVDFLIKVVSNEHTVTINQADGGTIAVKNGDAAVESGATVTSGTTLTIEATPNEGYLLTAVKVNTTEIAAKDGKYTYLVASDDVTITAEFTNKESFKPIVTIEQPTEGGTLSVSANDAEVASGNGVAYESTLTITATPASYAWKVLSVTANGEALTATEDGTYSLTVTEATTIAATFDTKFDTSNFRNVTYTSLNSSSDKNFRNVYEIILRTEKEKNEQTVKVLRGSVTLPKVSTGEKRDLWQDKTDQVIKVSPGDVLSINIKGTGCDACEYMYVDWNKNNEFEIEGKYAAGQNLLENDPLNEFVSYNMEKLTDADSNTNYYNSKGEKVERTNDSQGLLGGSTEDEEGPYFYLPSFTVPSVEPGKYYARFKTSWLVPDPNKVSDAGGYPEVIDFVIEVENEHTVSVAVPETNKNYGNVKIVGNSDDEKSVDTLTDVTVEAEATGYAISFMCWTDDKGNIVSKDTQYTYTGNENSTLTAHFGYKVWGQVNGNGKLTFSNKEKKYELAANLGKKKSAPALRSEEETESNSTTTTDNGVDPTVTLNASVGDNLDDMTLTAADDNGTAGLFEAGKTLYVNTEADGSQKIGLVYVINSISQTIVKEYNYTDEDNVNALSLELDMAIPYDVSVYYYDNIATGVEDIAVDAEAEAEYFNLNGVRVSGDLVPGVYIRRAAGKTEKVIIK